MRRIHCIAVFLAGSGLWALAASTFAYSFQLPAVAYTSVEFADDIISIVEQCRVNGEVEVYDPPYGELFNGSIKC